MADSEVFLDLLKEPSEELRGSTYDEVIDVKAHHSNCLTALTGTSMHRINEMLEKLINQLRRQFRQTLDPCRQPAQEAGGDEDFCFFFEEACFVVLP